MKEVFTSVTPPPQFIEPITIIAHEVTKHGQEVETLSSATHRK